MRIVTPFVLLLSLSGSLIQAQDLPFEAKLDEKLKPQHWQVRETVIENDTPVQQEATIDTLFESEKLQVATDADANKSYLRLNGRKGDTSIQCRAPLPADLVVELDFAGECGSVELTGYGNTAPWVIFYQGAGSDTDTQLLIFACDSRTSNHPTGWGEKGGHAGLKSTKWYHLRATTTDLETTLEVTDVEAQQEVLTTTFTHNPIDEGVTGYLRINTSSYNQSGKEFRVANLKIAAAQ